MQRQYNKKLKQDAAERFPASDRLAEQFSLQEAAALSRKETSFFHLWKTRVRPAEKSVLRIERGGGR